jgi:uncharacterized protein (DUF2235 family)
MKRLIVCCDGTWDKPGDMENVKPEDLRKGKQDDAAKKKPLDSNVCLLYNAILETENSTRQLKVYETGVGSGYSFKDQIEGGAAGAGIDKKIKDVYTFLIMNYVTGDEIYLFGFSRGAYTARSLAGLIRNCGILKPDYLTLLDKAFELYRDRNAYTSPDSDLMIGFRKQYSIENVTRIKFIGVWDTVGSLGIPLRWYQKYNRAKYKFHDVTLSSTVDNAFQAIATDEKRVLFKPALWEVSDTPNPNQKLEQRWFPGVHCNVGGGYPDRGLSNLTLQWMVTKAADVGLCFDRSKLEGLTGNSSGLIRNSRTFLYWFSPSRWREFKTDNCQKIDDSVYERMKNDRGYRPVNLKKYWPK